MSYALLRNELFVKGFRSTMIFSIVFVLALFYGVWPSKFPEPICCWLAVIGGLIGAYGCELVCEGDSEAQTYNRKSLAVTAVLGASVFAAYSLSNLDWSSSILAAVRGQSDVYLPAVISLGCLACGMLLVKNLKKNLLLFIQFTVVTALIFILITIKN